MNAAPTIEKRLSTFRLTLAVVLAASVLYPLFFAYIDGVRSLRIIVAEWLFTTIRFTALAAMVQGIHALGARVAAAVPTALRHLLQVVVACVLAYWFLHAFVTVVEVPLLNAAPPDPAAWTFRRYIGFYLLATVFIYAFLSGLHAYSLARRKELQAAQLQGDFAQVRLLALKSQVNPHFLFNSLSVLSSLVQVDAERSEKFIQRLAKAYRYILEQRELDLVSLREELGFLDAYFFLLQTRFGNKIKLEKNIPSSMEDWQLPPLSLQLLVENAVKHNRMSAGEPLVIKLVAEGDELVVENNRQVREQAEASTGVGLENIRRRYALLTHRKPVITATANFFRVQLPLLKQTP